MTNAEYALCCKALGDDTRIKIFDMLKNGKLCACVILQELRCTQPTLSYHMKILTDCALVNCEKKGKWRHYSINETTLCDLSLYISKPITIREQHNCD
ncbi:MAG: metalloregulator ArsR/SmtB family transcription factor [Clostridia bacterium]